MVIGSARPTVTLQKLQKWANLAPLPTDGKMLPDGDADHKFWREVVIAYRFPLVMVVLALVPILNFIAYSGHGGIGWLILPICFPWVIVKAVIKIMRGAEASRIGSFTS
jgi:hypothetical protein